MRVLIACEYSGAVRDAFIRGGHEAMSCDLLPTDVPGPHYQGDVFDVVDYPWDLLIAHPPCTDLAVSGAAWFAGKKLSGAQQARFLSLCVYFLDVCRAPDGSAKFDPRKGETAENLEAAHFAAARIPQISLQVLLTHKDTEKGADSGSLSCRNLDFLYKFP